MLSRLLHHGRTASAVCVALTLLTVSANQSLQAQGTDASIRGVVSDSAGNAIASATIEIRNTSSGFVSQLRTSERGRYSATQLPLGGPYRVVVRAVGYRTTSRDGLTLNIGSVVTADFRLTASSVQLQEVTVSAEPTRTIERNGAVTRIGEQQVRELPNQNRRFQDLTKLSPLAGNSLSLGGARPMSTDVRIDGVGAQMNNTGQTFAGPLTMTVEAIREFEIVTNEYDVSKGRQGGGLINAVTRSGTNAFAGSAFSYFRNKQLTTADLRGVPAQDFTVRQQGVSFSGPIIKDKLSFFTVYDRTDQSLPLEVTNVRNSADEIEIGISRDSLARMTSILARKYGLDTTQKQFGVFSRKPLSQAFFGRVDWQIAPQHRLTLRNNTTLYQDPEEIGPDQNLHYAESRGGAEVNSYGTLLSLRSNFRPTLVNEFKLQALRFTRERIARNELPRGFVRIASRLPDNTNRTTTVQFGGNRLAPENYNERQFQLANTLYWNRGNQTVTLGTDNIVTKIARYLPVEQRGLFEFDNLAQLDALTPARYSRHHRRLHRRRPLTLCAVRVGTLARPHRQRWRTTRRRDVPHWRRVQSTRRPATGRAHRREAQQLDRVASRAGHVGHHRIGLAHHPRGWWPLQQSAAVQRAGQSHPAERARSG
jgi:Carboxypeptidase regulatory-like domain